MKKVWSVTSTNGRWGIEIVSPAEGEIKWPARGTLKSLGSIEGRDVFRFDPDDGSQTWVLPGRDLEPLSGASTAIKMSLQSSDSGTIMILGPQAAVRSWGYKGRSSHVTLYLEGVAQDCPASILLALGLIEAQGKLIEIPPPPPVSGAMAEALRKAGLAK